MELELNIVDTPSMQVTIDKTLALAEKAKKRRLQKVAEEAALRAAEPPQQLLLPLLQPDERGMPNALARGALFNAAKSSEERKHYKGRIVASLQNFKVEYIGEELRQDDCSVLIALLYFQQSIPLGEPVHFTAYAMLKELGWSVNTTEYKHLRVCCNRLSATNLSIEFTDGASRGFSGSLLRSFAWKDETSGKVKSSWMACFEPNIARFFQEDSFSIIDPEIRRRISGRAPLAQWLHTFLNSHREPIPMTIAKYAELTDSRSKNFSDFKARLKTALGRLVESEFLESWSVKNDIVTVKRRKVSFAPPIYRNPVALEAPTV